jgi:hypothetical protein
MNGIVSFMKLVPTISPVEPGAAGRDPEVSTSQKPYVGHT